MSNAPNISPAVGVLAVACATVTIGVVILRDELDAPGLASALVSLAGLLVGAATAAGSIYVRRRIDYASEDYELRDEAERAAIAARSFDLVSDGLDHLTFLEYAIAEMRNRRPDGDLIGEVRSEVTLPPVSVLRALDRIKSTTHDLALLGSVEDARRLDEATRDLLRENSLTSWLLLHSLPPERSGDRAAGEDPWAALLDVDGHSSRRKSEE